MRPDEARVRAVSVPASPNSAATAAGASRPLSALAPDPRNPRAIGAAAGAGLGASMQTFGDIAGIVFNRRTGELAAGHQRVAQLEAAGAKTWTEEAGGSSGYIEHPVTAERFPVRIVDWTPAEQTAANLAANNPEIAGHFTEALPALLDEVQRGLPELFERLRFGALHVATAAASADWMTLDTTIAGAPRPAVFVLHLFVDDHESIEQALAHAIAAAPSRGAALARICRDWLASHQP